MFASEIGVNIFDAMPGSSWTLDIVIRPSFFEYVMPETGFSSISLSSSTTHVPSVSTKEERT